MKRLSVAVVGVALSWRFTDVFEPLGYNLL